MSITSYYTSELKKFVTSQYVFAGVRMTLAIVLPSIILAYFGLLREYFLFPLGTAFIGFTDFAGAFIRRRNTLILVVVCFFFAALVGTYIRDYPPLIFLGIVVFGIFFTMLGVYGLRMATVGGFYFGGVLYFFRWGIIARRDHKERVITYCRELLVFVGIYVVV